MQTTTTPSFRIIYTIEQHEFLGYLMFPYLVQLDAKGANTYSYKFFSEADLQSYQAQLDTVDVQIIKALHYIHPENIAKFYADKASRSTKKINTEEVFLKLYDKVKGNKAIQEAIDTRVDEGKEKALTLIKAHEKMICVPHKSTAIWHNKLQFVENPIDAKFYFNRHEQGTKYYCTLYHEGNPLKLKYTEDFLKQPNLICKKPAWLWIEDKIYHFKNDMDGNKIKPFLKKESIDIERKMEETYFTKFAVPLMRQFDAVEVSGIGLQIIAEEHSPKTYLLLNDFQDKTSQLFEASKETTQAILEVKFKYGDTLFAPEDTHTQFPIDVKLIIKDAGKAFEFKKIKRNLAEESAYLQYLKDLELPLKNAKYIHSKIQILSWLNEKDEALKNRTITIESRLKDNKTYFLGKPEISITIQEKQDWFDIKAVIRFGEFTIPFMDLRKYIIKKKREFVLPNGEIAIIPEAWFIQYSDLFNFSQESPDEEAKIKKYHINILNELRNGEHAQVVMNRKLEALREFTDIDKYELPKNFKTELRPYQKAGYDWLRFLQQYNFGGCLADDMGLGKTVITLCLLQAQRESNDPESKRPSLVIMPTTLLYNWQLEAKKFTKLTYIEYRGASRKKLIEVFEYNDVIFASYGVIRQDIEILKKYQFNYVILDEAQAIKNPTSGVAQAIHELKSRHRLTLTGTPIENTTLDLWSQMAFVNPGLLGSMEYFRDEYQYPIEKNQDTEKLKKLGHIIKPFMLRRLKSQVAQDLPPKVEQIDYCEMSVEQEKEYEQLKAQYRNEIIRYMEAGDTAKSNVFILEGLTKLRQVANHPKMIDKSYTGDSGKLNNVLHRLESIVEEGSKVLIFSQFVGHLDIIREYVREKNWKHSYLTGETFERQKQVEKFQNKENVQIFLISLRAGGVGLNLTSAEYVFMLDPWWNPAIEAQAIDRAHRIGQKKTVFIYKFITRHTVEEKILALQASKKQLAEDLITADENFVKSLSQEDLLQLLE